MINVNILNSILNSYDNLLIIRSNTNFGKTLKKIKKSNKEFVFIEKPKSRQMLAVITARLTGQKFLWIQNFENPPVPNFLTRLLLNQSDEIIVASRKEAAKLKALGIDKPRKRVRV